MSEFKLCGIVICGVVLCVVFKSIKSEYSLFIRLALTVLICMASFTLFIPILTYIEEISQNTYFHTYFPILIKILGIGIITELTSEICIDANEASIASKIGLFAKVEILVLTLPLLKSLLNMCNELLN